MNYLPILIMLESFAAAIIYVIHRQWGSAMYWFSSSVLNFAVIFLIKKLG